MQNPYHKMVSEYARLVGGIYPLGKAEQSARVIIARDAPCALLFSPHPDDECITGALPLRLLRECRMNVLNVAVTQGSRKDRQAERFEELRRACDYLGFGLLQTAERGLEKINPQTRASNPELWNEAVKVITSLLLEKKPRLVFMPHDKDWNSTHIGTHFLVCDALRAMPSEFCCGVCENEFWAPMNDPNLMVESSVADVSDMVTALSLHVGEVQRNPYHLRLPAWLQDNVRRGGELVGGQGGQAPNYAFASLYRYRQWVHGKFQQTEQGGRLISSNDSLAFLFG